MSLIGSVSDECLVPLIEADAYARAAGRESSLENMSDKVAEREEKRSVADRVTIRGLDQDLLQFLQTKTLHRVQYKGKRRGALRFDTQAEILNEAMRNLLMLWFDQRASQGLSESHPCHISEASLRRYLGDALERPWASLVACEAHRGSGE